MFNFICAVAGGDFHHDVQSSLSEDSGFSCESQC